MNLQNPNRYAGTIISTILVYAAMWCWLGINKDSSTFGPLDAPIFRNVALLTLGVGGFCSLLFHLMVKSKSQVLKEESDIREHLQNECNDNRLGNNDIRVVSHQDIPENRDIVQSETASMSASNNASINVSDWLRNPQLYQVAGLYMFSRLFVNVSQAYMPLYLNVTLELPATYVAIIPMIMYISGILVTIITKTVSKHLGIKITCGLYSIVGIIGCVLIHWGR